jgi:glycosyltransferase involved in cell wall biosynthesis
MCKVLVSTVIPAYNCAGFIADSITSALNQSYEPVEVIVVDDGSVDGTRDVVRSFGRGVRLLERVHGGPAAARNTAIAAARGELVAFLDADDLWKPHKLATQVPLFENPAVGLVYSNFDYIDANGRLIRTRLGRWYRGRIFREVMRHGLIWTGTVVARREVFKRVGGFDESMPLAEDWDMWLRVSAFYEIDYDIRTLSSYRMREGSLLGEPGFVEQMIYGLRKNFELYGRQAGVGAWGYRRTLAHYYYRLGNGGLPGSLGRRNRHYLWQAIRTNPFHFKALRAYFRGLCGQWRARRSGAVGLEFFNR